MNLNDIVSEIFELSDDLIIYAEPIAGKWTGDSPAVLVPVPEDGERLRMMGQQHEGMIYLIEVFLAKEVLSDYMDDQAIEQMSHDAKLRMLIYYAEHDAYPPAELVAVHR
jgi:hypothetical protein